MPRTSRLSRTLRLRLRRFPRVRSALRAIDEKLGLLHHSAAGICPLLIRPAPRQITIAVTARCNLRCLGCRYGRDFMVGAQLPLPIVQDALDDARAAGIGTARFFGGEPLLHPELPAMIRHAAQQGFETYVTTNGTLLADRIADLHAAGLRWMTIGYYGTGDDYDAYTQRPGAWGRLEAGLRTLREACGDALEVQLNFVLNRRSCSLAALHAAWDFARRFDLWFSVDPATPTIPFFCNEERDLLIREEQRDDLDAVVSELLRLKGRHSDRMPQSVYLLRALPDLLLGEEGLRIPCDAYRLVWIGANGAVQLCDSHFVIGNLHEQRLRAVLFGAAHVAAGRDAFRLRCPDCTCMLDSRIRKHAASVRRYRTAIPGEIPR